MSEVNCTPRPLMEGLLGVLAVWLLVRDVPEHATAIYALLTLSEDTASASTYLPVHGIRFGTNLLIGILLLILRRWIAAWLASDAESVNLKAYHLVAIGAAIIGVYYVGSGLASLIAILSFHVRFHDVEGQLYWPGVLEVFVGLVLFVGSRKLAARRLRAAADRERWAAAIM